MQCNQTSVSSCIEMDFITMISLLWKNEKKSRVEMLNEFKMPQISQGSAHSRCSANVCRITIKQPGSCAKVGLGPRCVCNPVPSPLALTCMDFTDTELTCSIGACEA